MEKVDLNIGENADAHKTEQFDIVNKAYDSRENLVVRRGQNFTFKIKFNRTYDAKKDDLRLEFLFGKLSNTATFLEQNASSKM